MNDKPQRYVVCAANRKADVIICGARHFDTVMRSNIKLLGLQFTAWEQGFIDQFGVFMTREEAFIVATDANQIRRRCGGDDGRLFSENLY